MASEDWKQTHLMSAAPDMPRSQPVEIPCRAPPIQDSSALPRELTDSLRQWSFFGAVRRLECTAKQLPRVGHSTSPSQDSVRFCQVPFLEFAPSDLFALESPESCGKNRQGNPLPPRFSVYFFGLLGPNGPLPLCLTEYVHRRAKFDDPTLRDFLDIFHHRMISLYYRAWASVQQVVQFDRGNEDRYSHYVCSFLGAAPDLSPHQQTVPAVAKLYYAGRLTNQTRNSQGLGAILNDYFQIPVRVEEFVGSWTSIPGDFRCILGKETRSSCLGRPSEGHAVLGASTAIIGERVWDCQQKVIIHVGPLGFKDYLQLVPPGPRLGQFIAWVRYYMGDDLMWDLHIILRRAEVPELMLGTGARLGWSTWLKGSEPDGAIGDEKYVVLHPRQARWHRLYESPSDVATTEGRDMIAALELMEMASDG